MKKIILILLLPIQMVFGQNELTLNECYQLARENYPNIKQSELYQEITIQKKENLKAAYLPQVALNAQATYQSDVPGINIPLPNVSIPSVSKDQYKAYAELKQTICDGGISLSNAKLEDALLQSNLSQLEVEIYQIKEKVAQTFFTVLIINKQIEIINTQQKILEEKLKTIESGIKNGLVEKSAALVLKAELLQMEQNKIQLISGKNAALKMLSLFIGNDVQEETALKYNPQNLPDATRINRPENLLFANQTTQLNTQIELLDKTRNPKFFGFGQAGYGKPGLNMLNNEFDTYYLIGVGVSWNAFDWKTTFRKKQIIQLQQQFIQNQEETFTQNIQILLAQQKEQINKFGDLLKSDQEIISLRNEITKAASSKLENQTITATEFIQELQAETRAKMNLELHKIQQNEAIEKYHIIQGNK